MPVAEEGFGDIDVSKSSGFYLGHLKLCPFPVKPEFINHKPYELLLSEVNSQTECKCKRFNQCGKAVMPHGSTEARYVIVGRDPGEQEVEHGEPFWPEAPGGRLLAQYLEALGLERDQVYITNCLFCRAPNNAPPTPDERFACSPFHCNEFKNLTHVEYIFPLGSDAFQVMTGIYSSITPFVGQRFVTSIYDRKEVNIIPVHHPGFCARRPSEAIALMKMLNKMSGRE